LNLRRKSLLLLRSMASQLPTHPWVELLLHHLFLLLIRLQAYLLWEEVQVEGGWAVDKVGINQLPALVHSSSNLHFLNPRLLRNRQRSPILGSQTSSPLKLSQSGQLNKLSQRKSQAPGILKSSPLKSNQLKLPSRLSP